MSSKLKRLLRDESGITALETAIILIAFVVVASVFAFTILSAGTSSTEKSKAAIYSGLEQVEGSMEVVGSVIAKEGTADKVNIITFTLASAGGAGVDMTDSGGDNKVVIDYQDEYQYETDISWASSEVVGDGDALLEQDEQFAITITGLEGALTTDLGPDTTFLILVKPPQGGVIPIERRTPSDFTTIMDLH